MSKRMLSMLLIISMCANLLAGCASVVVQESALTQQESVLEEAKNAGAEDTKQRTKGVVTTSANAKSVSAAQESAQEENIPAAETKLQEALAAASNELYCVDEGDEIGVKGRVLKATLYEVKKDNKMLQGDFKFLGQIYKEEGWWGVLKCLCGAPTLGKMDFSYVEAKRLLAGAKVILTDAQGNPLSKHVSYTDDFGVLSMVLPENTSGTSQQTYYLKVEHGNAYSDEEHQLYTVRYINVKKLKEEYGKKLEAENIPEAKEVVETLGRMTEEDIQRLWEAGLEEARKKGAKDEEAYREEYVLSQLMENKAELVSGAKTLLTSVETGKFWNEVEKERKISWKERWDALYKLLPTKIRGVFKYAKEIIASSNGAGVPGQFGGGGLLAGREVDEEVLEEARKMIGDTLWDQEMTDFTCGLVDFAIEWAIIDLIFRGAGAVSRLSTAAKYEKVLKMQKTIGAGAGKVTILQPMEMSGYWARAAFEEGITSGTKGVLKKLDELEAIEARLLKTEEQLMSEFYEEVRKGFQLAGWEIKGPLKRSDILNAARVRKIVEKTLAVQKTTATEEAAAKWIASADTPLEKAVMTDVVNALSDDVVMAAAKVEKLPPITAENVDDLVIDIVDDVPAAGGLRKITEGEILDGSLLNGKVSTSVEQLPEIASGEVSALAGIQEVRALEVKQLQNIVDACTAIMTRIAGSTTSLASDIVLGNTMEGILTAKKYVGSRENLTEMGQNVIAAISTILSAEGDILVKRVQSSFYYDGSAGSSQTYYNVLSEEVNEAMDEAHRFAISVKENLIRARLYETQLMQRLVENYGGENLSASYQWRAIEEAHKAFGLPVPATAAEVHPVIRMWLDQVNESVSKSYELLFQGKTFEAVMDEIFANLVTKESEWGGSSFTSITGDKIKEILGTHGVNNFTGLSGFPLREETELALRQYEMAAKVKAQAEKAMIDAFAENLVERSTQQRLGTDTIKTAGDADIVVSAYEENAQILTFQAQEALQRASKQYLFALLEKVCLDVVSRVPDKIKIGDELTDIVTTYKENVVAQEVMRRTFDELRSVENLDLQLLKNRFKANIEKEKALLISSDVPDTVFGDYLAGRPLRTATVSDFTGIEQLSIHEIGHVYGWLKSVESNEAVGIQEMYVDAFIDEKWDPTSLKGKEPGKVIYRGLGEKAGGHGAWVTAEGFSKEDEIQLMLGHVNAGIGSIIAEDILGSGQLSGAAIKDYAQCLEEIRSLLGKNQLHDYLYGADELVQKLFIEQYYKLYAVMAQDKEKIKALINRFVALEDSEWVRREISGDKLSQWFEEAGIRLDPSLTQVDMEKVLAELEKYQLLELGEAVFFNPTQVKWKESYQYLEVQKRAQASLYQILDAINNLDSGQSFDFSALETTEKLAQMGQTLRNMEKLKESLEKQGSGQGLSTRSTLEDLTDSIRALAQAEREFGTLKLTDGAAGSKENAMELLEKLKDSEGTNLYGLAVVPLADFLSYADMREENNQIIMCSGEEKVQITGRVIDSKTKKPVTSAGVELYYIGENSTGNGAAGEPVKTVRVLSDGSFTFDGMQGGDYRIRLQAEGYQTKECSFKTTAFKALPLQDGHYVKADIGDIKLEKWDEDALLYAFVREEGTDKPIKGAAISFYRTDPHNKSVRWQTEKTNKFGEASHVILGDGYGEYRFTISAEGYEKVTVDKKITKENRSLSVKLAPMPKPTASPTVTPTVTPSVTPSVKPTVTPSAKPSATPSVKPTATPSVSPTATPRPAVTVIPQATPSLKPTVTPTATPSPTPTVAPTETPSPIPAVAPTVKPTVSPAPTPS